MADSFRIKTDVGLNKQINIKFSQDFDFLEILSLKITQDDIYTRNCSDYGVIVGRITANNGYGLSNVKVSVFVPISEEDKSNPVISTLYPYTSTNSTNEDGYRYNLLPYVESYKGHIPTGTFPSRDDVLKDETLYEIYEKYYKYTVKTNDSGDYMIFGVPVGPQTVFVDIDLSDIGEFSLTPNDLIRMGLANESQLVGNRFNSSTNLNELPQIISLQKSIDVSPLWGQEEVCDVSINRVDFDLREDANVDIQPTSIFIGSIFSTGDKYRVRKNCKPKDDMGNLCNLETGPGQILSIRQTINEDNEGRPILEEYRINNSGTVIDGDGSWVVELPMNLEYITTNEYGERVVTNDTKRGIPTKGKYRFKIKWEQPNSLTEQVRRAYFLVPNVREYWTNNTNDPNYFPKDSLEWENISGSYYFGLDWTGYTDYNSAVNCEDTFYEFEYNRVYTVSGLIDNYKNGSSRGRFIGIKEIDDDSCTPTVNKFPVNDGVRNFDLVYFIFSILFQIFQMFGVSILISYHAIAFLWNFLTRPVLSVLSLGALRPKKFGRFKLPMITYPDCQACDCESQTIEDENGVLTSSLLTQLSDNSLYYDNILSILSSSGEIDDDETISKIVSESLAGRKDDKKSVATYKSTESKEYRLLSDNKKVFGYSFDLPLAERINIFNTRKKFFDGINRIRVTFNKPSNSGKQHYDNTVTILLQDKLESGTLLTFVNPDNSQDVNFLVTQTAKSGEVINGLTGNTMISGYNTLNVNYATSQNEDASVSYLVYNESQTTNYKFPSDIEYYQVISAITISDATKIWDLTGGGDTLPKILSAGSNVFLNTKDNIFSWGKAEENPFNNSDLFDSFKGQYITILQRGVDPYSPKFVNEYGLGRIFGKNGHDDIVITAETRLNIPVQKISDGYSIQMFGNQSSIFYPSYFFTPGTSFSAHTTSNIGYYGSLSYANAFQYKAEPVEIGGIKSVVSKINNRFYNNLPNEINYDGSEDLSGCGYYYGTESNGNNTPSNTEVLYYSPTFKSFFESNPMSINNRLLNVIRTDRLPSSDYLDGFSWDTNASLLQQNLGFNTYTINADSNQIVVESYGLGSNTYNPDLEDTIAYEALNTFDCTNMVGLKCYSGNGTSFGIKENCQDEDSIENGCYVFMSRPILDLPKDIKSFAEWGYRFRFFYGICRGVLSQTFSNNWVNGSLYAFPIQVNTTYNSNNEPNEPDFCKELIFFDDKTNNFYYRSSPYNILTKQFIGKRASSSQNSNNQRNLLYPTTIMNMGMKNKNLSETSFDLSSKMYTLDKIGATSYGDTSDLVNLFIISRITDQRFFSQFYSFVNRNNSLEMLFSRENSRVDGDLAQLLSINSENGVIKFSPEFYVSSDNAYDPVIFVTNNNKNSIGVFFSSTTEDLQYKDFISPGRLDIRTPINNTLKQLIFGNKSQLVPFYSWKLSDGESIFGNEKNDWATDLDSIYTRKYQGLDRLNQFDYFLSPNYLLNDTYARGYIFNVDNLGRYEPLTKNRRNEIIMGAPNHFYFGLIKGKTAMDKFKTKYLPNE